MKRTLMVFAFLAWMAVPLCGQVVDFDELPLAPGTYFDGYGSGASAGSWSSNGAEFNTNQWGPGWSYSNVNDTTTAGFTNQWAAFTGTGLGGSGNYALANSCSPNGAYINLPYGVEADSIWVTNATYPAISMRDGDAFAKQFGGASGDDPDYFKLTFTGFTGLAGAGSETGAVEFFLADFRFANNSLDYIIDDWTLVDLDGLGRARSIGVTLESTDVGTFGMNTPAYVAIDSFAMSAIPEPTSPIWLSGLAALWMVRRRRVRGRA